MSGDDLNDAEMGLDGLADLQLRDKAKMMVIRAWTDMMNTENKREILSIFESSRSAVCDLYLESADRYHDYSVLSRTLIEGLSRRAKILSLEMPKAEEIIMPLLDLTGEEISVLKDFSDKNLSDKAMEVLFDAVLQFESSINDKTEMIRILLDGELRLNQIYAESPSKVRDLLKFIMVLNKRALNISERNKK